MSCSFLNFYVGEDLQHIAHMLASDMPERSMNFSLELHESREYIVVSEGTV